MRVKKSILVSVALIFLAILIVAPMRVYSDPSPVTVMVEMPDGYIPGEPLGSKFWVHIRIDASELTFNGPDGIVFWAMYVKTDPAVLKPFLVKTCVPGYFLYDFAEEEFYDYPSWVKTIDPDTGMVDVAEMFFAPLPPGGAATTDEFGPLPTLYLLVSIAYEVMTDDINAYTLIDIIDPVYTALEAPEGKISMEDVDGHYNSPPPHAEFTYTPSMPLVDETVTFNASASYDPDGYIESYEWDFGDETTGTGMVVTHNYTEAGTYTVTLNVTDNDALWDIESQNVTVYGPPVASFTYSPSEPSLGETVTFNASASYDPDGGNETYPSGIVSYEWDFGDGTTRTETDPIITHKYFEAGTYTVTLNVTDDEGSTKSRKKKVTVSGAAAAAELKVEVDVGSIHFRGEIAEFYVLTSFMGEPVNATQINSRLYHGGTLHGDLSEFVENITTGLYRVPYTIPIDAPVGTYVLVVNASFFTQNGVSFKSFLLSPTLTDQNALITDIEGDIATISTDVGAIKANLTAIDATLVGMEGTIAIISSTIGEFTAPADTICATLTAIEGTVATIDSTLGSIEADIDDINGEISDIDGTLVTIQTSIGLIETNVTAINATIVDVQAGLVTINSTLGDIKLNLNAVSVKLVSVQGDIEEGVANITGAITDAEGNILAELGEVEVRLEDINATLVIIDGSLVTIRTDIGTIEGTITSIRGDIATIETDIGVIKAILEEWTGVTTSSITTPVGTFDIMVLTNSTLEGPVTFSDNALTMIVSGQTGTTGILNVKIPRQLLIGIGSNIEDLAVAINGRRGTFTYTEEAELYVVRVIYMHSTHTINIYLSESQTPQTLTLWILLVVMFTIAMSAIVATPYILAARKRRIKQ